MVTDTSRSGTDGHGIKITLLSEAPTAVTVRRQLEACLAPFPRAHLPAERDSQLTLTTYI